MFAPFVGISSLIAVLVQNVYGECFFRNSYNVGSCGCRLAYDPLSSPWLGGASGVGYESGLVPASDGGGFLVQRVRRYLAVAGQVPFLGTAYLEGTLPSAGAGAVSYGCGYGEVAIIIEEGSAPASFTGAPFAYYTDAATPWIADINYNGLGPCGCSRELFA